MTAHPPVNATPAAAQTPAPSAPQGHPNPSDPPPSWWQALRVYAQPASVRMLVLGFSAGLPLLLVLGTLGFRLREAGIERSTIGHLSWVGLAYGFKWVWAPLVDRLALPGLGGWLGRRRSWLLLAQAGIALGLLGMAWFDPAQQLGALVGCALLVAFASATQDIALDAYRIESAPPQAQAALAACYQTGYRLAMIWAGAGVLWIAAAVQQAHSPGAQGYSHLAWQSAYAVMALSLLPGALTVLFTPAPARSAASDASASPVASLVASTAASTERGAAVSAPVSALERLERLEQWLHAAVVAPFADFWQRYRWQAVQVLALIAVYRISDVVMGIMANPFYVDMGFSKEEVATVTKLYGVLMTLLGSFVGGLLAARLGLMRVLLLGAVLSAASNVLFAWLHGVGHNVQALVWVVSADNLASGIASAAFIAYLSALTNVQYSATQYAMLSSMMLLLPKYIAGFSGDFVDAHGYVAFFQATAWLGLPVCLLVWWVARTLPRPDGRF